MPNLESEDINFLTTAYQLVGNNSQQSFAPYELPGVPPEDWNRAERLANDAFLSRQLLTEDQPSNARYRLTNQGIASARAHLHKSDANRNLALLKAIHRMALGQTGMVVDASEAATTQGLSADESRRFIEWLHTGRLIERQTPQDVWPTLVKMTESGKRRVEQEIPNNWAYWLTNNQSLGAVAGALLGSFVTHLFANKSGQSVAGSLFVAGLLVGGLCWAIVSKFPFRLQWRIFMWIVAGALMTLLVIQFLSA